MPCWPAAGPAGAWRRCGAGPRGGAHVEALHEEVLAQAAVAVPQELVQRGERQVGSVHDAPQVRLRALQRGPGAEVRWVRHHLRPGAGLLGFPEGSAAASGLAQGRDIKFFLLRMRHRLRPGIRWGDWFSKKDPRRSRPGRSLL